MKFLTLNTHSWMEKEAEEKFQLLLEDILDKDYDLICFQEINQEITSPEVEVNDLYQALPVAEPIHQDQYAYRPKSSSNLSLALTTFQPKV